MSCRVLKRGMEGAMLDRMAGLAKARGIASLVGYYRPTAKNQNGQWVIFRHGLRVLAGRSGGRQPMDFYLGPYENRNSIIRVKHD